MYSGRGRYRRHLWMVLLFYLIGLVLLPKKIEVTND